MHRPDFAYGDGDTPDGDRMGRTNELPFAAISPIVSRFTLMRSSEHSVQQMYDLTQPLATRGYDVNLLIAELAKTDMELCWRAWSDREVGSLTVSQIWKELNKQPRASDYLDPLAELHSDPQLEEKLLHHEWMMRCRFGDLPPPDNFGLSETNPSVATMHSLRPTASVTRGNRLLYVTPSWGELLIGRQARFSNLFPSLRREAEIDKLTCAKAAENTVSRKQCKMQVVSSLYAILTNPSDSTSILLNYKNRLQPREAAVVSFPFHLHCGITEVEISRSSLTASDITATPCERTD